MRINPDYGAHEPENSRAENQSAQATGASVSSVANSSVSSVGEDQALLFSGHAQVQALAAQALQLPEVRLERVQALQQAVTNGSYNPSPEDVAGAIVSQLIGEQAA